MLERKGQVGQSGHASAKRVAQIIGTFGGGGAQRLAFNLAVGLAQLDVRSTAVALRYEGEYGEASNTGVNLVALNARKKNPVSVFNAWLRLRTLIFREKPDVVHVHGAPSLPFVATSLCLMQHKPRLFFTWQDSESVLTGLGWRRRIMIWALRRCDSVSGSSHDVAKKLAERAGLRNVGVFHGGVPVSKAQSIPRTDTPLILWLGRIVPSKDPQILVRAAARLKSEGFEFQICIVGKPTASTEWYMEETASLITKFNIESCVKLTGFMTDDELHELMKRAEISVQTSHTEGMSIALMEHMMAGLAIVATDVGDTNLAVQDHVSGLLIPPRDEEALVGALKSVLTSVALRERLGREARTTALRRFSIEAMVNRALQQYEAH